MRWGVREDAYADHQTVEMVTQEIGKSQKISLGPSFVVRASLIMLLFTPASGCFCLQVYWLEIGLFTLYEKCKPSMKYLVRKRLSSVFVCLCACVHSTGYNFVAGRSGGRSVWLSPQIFLKLFPFFISYSPNFLFLNIFLNLKLKVRIDIS